MPLSLGVKSRIIPRWASASWVIGFTLLGGSLGYGEPASVATISPSDLVEYQSQPPAVKVLIERALALTKRELAYTYGSNSPSNQGMDCSGSVQFTLKSMAEGEVPRSSYGMYHWVKESGKLIDTPGVVETTDPVFALLKPGDLLFWIGTQTTSGRVPPISHVMVYLGTLREDGKGVVFGASSGRRYRGKKIHGVSVFDWKVPSESSAAEFVGFGAIPGLVNETKILENETKILENAVVAPPEKKKVLKSVLEFLFRKPDRAKQ